MSRITQKGQGAPLSLVANGSVQTSTDANLATLVGTRYDLSDGREVMLVSVGATAISTAGVLLQDRAIVANHQSCTVATYTAPSANGNVPPSALVAIGATALVANEYQGGFAMVIAGPGIGSTLKIAANGSHVASATQASLTFEEAPSAALTTSSLLSLIPPHGANVVVMPTTPTGAVAGVSVSPIAAGIAANATSGTPSFGFVTTKGLCSVLSDATVASVGQSIAPSVTTAGSVTLASTGTLATIGYANATAISAQARSVFLNV